jgi:hypothetical protein
MTTIILDRKIKGTHEIRFRDKETGENTTLTIMSSTETIFSLKKKLKEVL